MKFDAKQLKAAVENIRLPEDMGERLLKNCSSANGRANGSARGAKRGSFAWRKAFLAGVAACAVLVAGFGLWKAGGERLWREIWDTPIGATASRPTEELSQPEHSGTEIPTDPDVSGGNSTPEEPFAALRFRGLSDVEELREAMESGDETSLLLCLERFATWGMGAEDMDMAVCLELLDSLPYLPILEGQIVSIEYIPEFSEVTLLLEDANGDQAELEYDFDFKDPVGFLMTFSEDLLLAEPFVCCDGRVTVYVEGQSREHGEGGRAFKVWHAVVDGMYLRVIYYTEQPNRLAAEDVFGGLEIRRLTDLPSGEDPSGEELVPNRFAMDLRSVQDLEELREMAVSADGDVLQAYLLRKGMRNREELTEFLELLDSLPYLPILDGKLIWIGYDSGLDFDSRQPYTENATLFISTEAQNGDWVRLQYTLPVGERPTVTGDGELLMISGGGWQEKHPTAPGMLTTWELLADGLRVRVAYYSADPDSVVTEEVFAGLAVCRFGDWVISK